VSNAGEPIQEPENSTVDDWLGQRVARDEERADELVNESGGDLEEAARRFDAESDEAQEYHRHHDQA
jgi:hypothetical protein